ncbi:putative PfkB family kinase [Xylaria sp. CBS 124048]|nr:putative PfkB family kinase [Xylaria sp. CBS 124048]
MAQAKPPVFVSLGMFILDELRFPHLKTVSDVPGGSGFYATLGARLFKPYPQSLDVGCIILGGHDIPQSAVDLLESWRINLFLHRDPEQKCTRGLLQYEDDAFSRNTFDYVTPPLRPSPEHLVQSNLLHAQAFHFLNLPADLERNVTTLLRLRAEHGISTRPLIVWEPAPMGCTAAYLDATLKACAHVDIFSPNRSELRALLSGTRLSTSSSSSTTTTTEKQGDANDNTNDEFSRSTIESQATHFLTAGINPHKTGHAVIRAGEHGVLVQSLTHPPQWLPTYYTSIPSTPSTPSTSTTDNKNDENDKNKNKKKNKKVIDATGAGNAFLGAFAVSFHDARPGDVVEACLRGAVAASFALEQFGPPTLSYSLWNGENVMTRLNELKARISKT